MKFDVHPAARASINSIAANALSSVEKITVVQQGDGGKPWWLPEDTLTITDADIVGDPIMWLPQANGSRAFVFLFQGDDCFGLSEANHKKLDQLCGALLKIKWVQKAVSENYITDSFINWARNRYQQQDHTEFLDHFVEACTQDVVEQTVWAPVQHLVVEQAFDFGRARIIPMGDAFFAAMQAVALAKNPDRVEIIGQFMDDFRSKMRGCSAVEVKILAEPQYAKDAALQACDDAIGLLRFFCAATCGSAWMSPVALLEALNVPQVYLLIGEPEEGMSYTRGGKLELVDYWRISKAEADALAKEDLADVGSLIDADDLDDFGRAVRSSTLAFTRATTFSDLSDRLVFAFSAIEGLMLRNQSEAIQQNVGERVAFLISTKQTERQAIVENFRNAYGMRSHYIHHRVSNLDTQELDKAFLNIRAALSCAIANLKKFTKRDDFIAAIEQRKFGG